MEELPREGIENDIHAAVVGGGHDGRQEGGIMGVEYMGSGDIIGGHEVLGFFFRAYGCVDLEFVQ
jgi:hypothetical protein